jgi:uncharacterized protein (DUF1015 family)
MAFSPGKQVRAMAKIVPFKGLRYNPSKVEINNVIAPPYDVIGEEGRELLHDRHQNNIVRLIKGKDLPDDGPDENKYTRAGKCLDDWIADGVLVRDVQPCVYAYEQQYQYLGDKPRTRRGFIALVRLEDDDSRVILGHEHTLMKPKLDRLSLMKECRANLSPVFSLFSQPDGKIDSILVEMAFTPSTYDFVDDNMIRNRLWVVSDPEIIDSLTSPLEEQSVIIADGHHRYETSLIYRHIRRRLENVSDEDNSHDYTMMMFVNLDGEGVTIYPIHRIVYGIADFDPDLFRRRLEEHFELTAYPFTDSNREDIERTLMQGMARMGKTTHSFGLYLGGNRLDLLKARDPDRLRQMISDSLSESRKSLDVSVVHSVILHGILGLDLENISKEEHVRYTPTAQNALGAVRRGEAQIALLLNPTKPEQVKAITAHGDRMPQKSTFFYPKLLSGLVINRFDS